MNKQEIIEYLQTQSREYMDNKEFDKATALIHAIYEIVKER